jgi:hypothetical protein
MAVQMTILCPKPDNSGCFNPRCEQVIEKPRGEETRRQCRAAALRGTRFCCVHQKTTKKAA